MRTIRQILIVALFLSAGFLNSQNEGKNWYFGNLAGLSFTSTPPTVTTGQLSTSEGCSSISDANGDLLFYTDGLTVYDKTHTIMLNGTGLFGDGSTTQSGVIMRRPGSTTIYYIFTADDFAGPNGLCYSIVDMTLNGGLGAVTTKNTLLHTPTTEKITGVKHCNGVDIWVLTHDYNSDVFRTYLLTSAGVSATPVLSAVGTNHSGSSSLTVGAIKTSPNGKKIGICMSNVINNIELYDFDNTTGAVSNPLILANIVGIYGCEFSPDGTKFYGSPWAGNRFYQWDLCAGSGTAIIASQQTITASNCGLLQLAPDGKIYMARSGQNSLGVINDPNNYGVSCNYVNNGQTLGANNSTWGLPNFITSFLSAPFTYTQACGTVSFTPPAAMNPTNSGCSASGNTVTALKWIFGDPGSGTLNTTTLTNPSHNYNSAGTYTVQLIRTTVCGNDTISLPLSINSSSMSFNAVPQVTQSSCTSTLNAFDLGLSFIPANPVPGYTITWNTVPTGVTSDTQVASSNVVPGVYQATIAIQGGCWKITSFTVNPHLGVLSFSTLPKYELTCLQQSVTVSVDPAYNYTWTSLSAGPYNGSSVTLTPLNVGTWTIQGANISGCVGTKTFALVQNTTTPSSSISPLTQNITCSLSSITTITATANPSINVTHIITSPQGGVFSSNSYSTVYLPGGTGTFTHCALYNENGCTSCKTFTVSSNQGFPTFNIVSPDNFTLGCNSKSVATINIINGSASGGGAVSYTLLSPSSSSSTPPGTLSAVSVYTVNSPGNYTVITKDNVSFCETRTPMTILQNTFAPNLSVSVPRNILTCTNPTVLLQGFSTTPKVSFGWSFPPVSGPGNAPEYSLSVTAFTAQPTTTLVANYTLTITDNNNTCRTNTVIPIYQSVFPPKAVISNGGTNAISCKTPTVTLTNQSSTTIPPGFFQNSDPVIGFLWMGPSPQEPRQVSSSYVGATPGTYTMIAKDMNNGCMTQTVIIINDEKKYPLLNNPEVPPPSILDCNSQFAKLWPIVTNGTSGLTYTWTAPPAASVTGQNTATLSTNIVGDYTVLVTNTVNGCSSRAYMIVEPGTLTARYTVPDSTGFAPFDLNITNTSFSTLDNKDITSIWSFGNGVSLVTGSVDKPVFARYPHAGTYTLTLFTIKGECLDTFVKVIRVELPSELVIPNIFTPNADGNNDIFHLKATNLTEIHMIIYDRWGHLVYELTSHSGNIAWDGKNQFGDEVADGVYFYVLAAIGLDGQEFKKNGNITIVR